MGHADTLGNFATPAPPCASFTIKNMGNVSHKGHGCKTAANG
jgi:hypothetical protein